MSFLELKNKTIILIFSLSIFFSHVVIYNFQLRFIYLFLFLFLFYDLFKKKIKINNKITLLSAFILFLIIIHGYFNLINQDNLDYKILFKISIKSALISLSIILIYYYKDLFLGNLTLCINIFLSVFYFYLIYILISSDNFYNFNLINCSNLFRFDKLLFKELSHFQLLSVPVILYSIINFKEIAKKKINTFLIFILLVFSFLNFSLTFFLGIIGGSIIILLVSKNFNKTIITLLLVINFLNLGIFLNQKDTCAAKRIGNLETYKNVLSPREKLLTTGIFSKGSFSNNYSFKIYMNSFYVAMNSLNNNILGYGFDNYKFAFKNFVPEDYEKEKEIHPYRELNTNDASNNFSKLTSEFGIFF